MRILRALAVATVLTALGAVPGAAQAQQGTVVGRVTESGTSKAVTGAQVVVMGTTRGTITDNDGRYRIGAVPAGNRDVRVVSLGYESRVASVSVPNGGTVTADFSIPVSAVTLDQILVTATGEQQRKRQMGTSVATISLTQGAPPATQTLTEVLNARAPGVSIFESTGTTGASAPRIRIRGASSISLDNNPLLIVDGVRADNNATNSTLSINLGGQVTNRLNDINPDDIDSIEVLKGPAAAALYGTAAANGVIQITTKRGRAGRGRWSFTVEGGDVKQKGGYPNNYQGLDANGKNCSLSSETLGSCTVASVASFNPLVAQSPFRTGANQKYAASVNGGSDVMTYYVSGDWQNEDGVYAINSLRQANFRANLQAEVRSNLRLNASTGYVSSRGSFPQNDNNVLGILPQGLLGGAFGDSLHNNGWFSFSPQTLFNLVTVQDIGRLTSSGAVDWQPWSWLKLTAVGGLDNENRFDHQTVQPQTVAFGSLPDGQRTSNRYLVNSYTFNSNATASATPLSNLTAATSVGVQYEKTMLQSTNAFGAVLLQGTNSVNGTAARFSVSEDFSDLITVGAYGQEQLGWRDRVYLTGSLRGDDNSGFGQSFGAAWYPAVSGSWVISDEPFFPKGKLIDNLRLRGAWGQSSLPPQFRFAENFYTPIAVVSGGTDVGGITVGGNGLPTLKPERSTEMELGFEASTLSGRLGIDFTYYNKVSKDALLSRVLAPSLGQSNSRFENIGQLSNRGAELQLTATPLHLSSVQLELVASGSVNRNRIDDMGGLPPIIFDPQRHVQGFPAGGYWARPILSYQDKNGDGIISRANCTGGPVAPAGSPCEITLGDTAVYLGSSIPTRLASLGATLTVFRNLRLYSLLDYKGGMKQYNLTEDFRCQFGNNAASNVIGSDLKAQAACAARLLGDVAGYIEDGSFLKLREVSATYQLPRSLVSRISASGVAFTLAGRELHTWSKYTGLDPEVIQNGGANFTQRDFLTQPPVRRVVASVKVDF